MAYLVINGGKKLQGKIATQTTKNSALSILCATLMIRGRTKIVDVPKIEDVDKILRLVASAGAVVERPDNHTVIIDTTDGLKVDNLDKESAEKTRASLLLLGALSAQVKSYKLYKSGGCHLGERTVRPHLYALEKLGVHVASEGAYFSVRNEKPLHASTIVMYESGDTTTENAVLAAVLASGTTTIKMASANYMVQDLCYFLVAAGAKISGIGTTTLTIEGVKALKPVAEYALMPDPIVAMTLISAAIVTGSNLTVTNCPLEFLELELEKLSVMGQKFTLSKQRLSKNGKFTVADITLTPSKLVALPDKIYGRPFPGLNIDNLPLFIPILAKSEGRTLVHDWVYEDRAIHSLDLKKLGVAISLIDTHRVWVEGPNDFKPNEVVAPPALRPAVNVLLVMLAAKGKSILRNFAMIDRGYDNLYEALNAVGADIKKVVD